MNPLMKIVLLMAACLLALYINMWYLVLPLSAVYGWFSEARILKTGLVAFVSVFAVWAISIYVLDGTFARSPSGLLAGVLGGIPSGAVPLIGGLIGGLVSLFAASGGRALAK